jgi:SOS-response transcriptional repressor LexA
MSDELYPPASLSEDMARNKREEREQRAARLKEARMKAGFKSMPAAARAMRVNVETYKAHETGRNGFDTPDARIYARTFKVSASWLMTGDDKPDEAEGAARTETGAPVPYAEVIGEVAAGRWLQVEFHDEAKYEPVPFVPGRYADLPQTAYRVVGPSMDMKRIEDGDFIICVPYMAARTSPQSHDIVVVEMNRGGEIERTCKELIVGTESYELWPRSSHPSFAHPIIIPRIPENENQPWATDDDSKTVSIVGLVIGRFRPFGQNY